MNSLYVAIGGALGSVARYQMDGWVQAKLGARFPYGTLAVNVVGSFLLALFRAQASAAGTSDHSRRSSSIRAARPRISSRTVESGRPS